MKTQVSFEEIAALHQRLDEINSVPFGDIEWMLGGSPVAVPEGVCKEWRFVGMCNEGFPQFLEASSEATA